MSRLVDNRLNIETPEGVEFQLTLAGPLPRIIAATIDMILRGLLYGAIAAALAILGDSGTGIFLICMFFIEWGYPIAFEMFANGATPGKKLMGLRVRHTDGTPIGWHASILRNLLRIADFLPFANALGIITMSANKNFQRLGDLAAGTIVCYQPDILAKQINKLTPNAANNQTFRQAEPVLIAEKLHADEQAAIVSFAERSRSLGPERAQEIATIVEPLSGTNSGHKNLIFLHGLARRIVQ